jgi:hypothetical protein
MRYRQCVDSGRPQRDREKTRDNAMTVVRDARRKSHRSIEDRDCRTSHPPD